MKLYCFNCKLQKPRQVFIIFPVEMFTIFKKISKTLDICVLTIVFSCRYLRFDEELRHLRILKLRFFNSKGAVGK
ncbi:MAG: hypothetical protein FWF51_09175 [Chitinivibrionia bacterium]|nr:hypothetical protein [Chitinivibrionia bacterium]